jgi:NAD(P)-dependent dehydrogenase (short-subunit alcohol dehydrogenase family)
MLFGDFRDVTPEDFDRTIATTFTGAVDLIRAAMPHLERTHGTIVVTGSIMATVPLPTFTAYAASKHALRGFVNTLRIELRRTKSPVSISLVHPGAVDTPLWDHLSSAGRYRARNPPDLYSPDVIARALVACAVHPRPEFTVGGEARLIELGWGLLRAPAEIVLGIVSRFYASSRQPALPGGLLREGVGTGKPAGGRHGRPSLWAWLRLGRAFRRPEGPA